VVNWPAGDAFVGLGIGDTEYWSKGYGTDSMHVLLRFAFTELNLQRVTLSVFEYNPRAIRSYEKAGFRHEGRMRKVLNKEGRRWDVLYMGILREEWLELDRQAATAGNSG
jgi:RimJ/RimL family protein N-acetyltransferase